MMFGFGFHPLTTMSVGEEGGFFDLQTSILSRRMMFGFG
jgi:hypothetical protein